MVPSILFISLLAFFPVIHGAYYSVPFALDDYYTANGVWNTFPYCYLTDVNNDGLEDIFCSVHQDNPPNIVKTETWMNNGCGWLPPNQSNMTYCEQQQEYMRTDIDRVIRRVLEAERNGIVSTIEADRLITHATTSTTLSLLSKNILDDKAFFSRAIRIISS